MNSNQLEKAIKFAQEAHSSQFRKYSGLPYFTHLLEVQEIVASIGACYEIQCAALLHDTIEDTPVTYEQIFQEFGLEIAELVKELTDVYTHEAFPNLNRKIRKSLEAERTWKISANAQTVKFADFLSNGYDIMKYNKGFGRLYFAEIEYAFLNINNGDKTLRNKITRMLEELSKEKNHQRNIK